MADVYLHGQHPLHRHEGLTEDRVSRVGLLVWPGDGSTCATDHAHLRGGEGATPVQVHLFDRDALTAHDEAVRRTAEQGEGPHPLLADGEWQWAIVAPLDPGQSPDEARVLAGWTADGAFHRYCTPEQLARAFREYAGGGTVTV